MASPPSGSGLETLAAVGMLEMPEGGPPQHLDGLFCRRKCVFKGYDACFVWQQAMKSQSHVATMVQQGSFVHSPCGAPQPLPLPHVSCRPGCFDLELYEGGVAAFAKLPGGAAGEG